MWPFKKKTKTTEEIIKERVIYLYCFLVKNALKTVLIPLSFQGPTPRIRNEIEKFRTEYNEMIELIDANQRIFEDWPLKKRDQENFNALKYIFGV